MAGGVSAWEEELMDEWMAGQTDGWLNASAHLANDLKHLM